MRTGSDGVDEIQARLLADFGLVSEEIIAGARRNPQGREDLCGRLVIAGLLSDELARAIRQRTNAQLEQAREPQSQPQPQPPRVESSGHKPRRKEDDETWPLQAGAGPPGLPRDAAGRAALAGGSGFAAINAGVIPAPGQNKLAQGTGKLLPNPGLIPASSPIARAATPLPGPPGLIAAASASSNRAVSPPPNSDSSLEGRRIGRYLVEREIGRGGMGVVYLGRSDDGQAVAVKILKSEGDDQLIHRERLAIESTIVSRLRHPNIVQVKDILEQEDGLALVMEYIEGETLDARLERSGRLSPMVALDLTRKLGEALQHAHDRRIVHRDVKPANVILREDGEPLLMDFGLAKELDASRQLSKSGEILGTLPYMPPEQLDSTLGRVDERADIYALGATLFEMLTAEKPFEEDRADALAMAILTRPAPSPRQLVADLPAGIEVIVERCLAKVPEQRYQSTWDVAEDCRRLMSGEALRARPVTWLEALRLWARRRPAQALGAISLSLVLPLVLSLIAVDRQSRAASEAIRELSLRKIEEEKARAAQVEAEGSLKKAEAARDEARRAEATARDLSRDLELALARLRQAEESAKAEARRATDALGQVQFNVDKTARARDEARRHAAAMRDLTLQLLLEVEESLRELPGATRPRQLLAQNGLRLLDQAASQGLDEPAALQAVAVAYVKVGEVYGSLESNSLGDSSRALVAYNRARGLLETLVKKRPKDPEARRNLLLTADRCFGELRSRKDLKSAQLVLDETEAQAEWIRKNTPPLWSGRDMLAVRESSHSALLVELGKIDEAEQALTRAEAILEPIFRAQPSLNSGSALAMLRQNRGVFALNNRTLDEARRRLENSVQTYRELKELAGSEVWAQIDLANSINSLGATQLALGDFKSAMSSFLEADTLLAPISDSSSALARRRRVMVLFNLANLQTAAGSFASGKASLELADELIQELLAKDINNLALKIKQRELQVQKIRLERAAGELDERGAIKALATLLATVDAMEARENADWLELKASITQEIFAITARVGTEPEKKAALREAIPSSSRVLALLPKDRAARLRVAGLCRARVALGALSRSDPEAVQAQREFRAILAEDLENANTRLEVATCWSLLKSLGEQAPESDLVSLRSWLSAAAARYPENPMLRDALKELASTEKPR